MAKKAQEEEQEESIFDEAEVSEEIPTDEDMTPDEQPEEEFNVTVSDESPAEKLARKGLKEKADGRTLTIQSVFHTRPRVKNQDGTTIPPKLTIAGDKEFYGGKLGIRFEEDNLVEYYPSFHYFVNEGKINTLAKINRAGNNAVAKLFNLAVEKMGKPIDEVSDKDFYDYLVGKQVVIKTEEGVYQKKAWFRNDIVKIL